MCIVKLAKTMNIFNRDSAEITKADVIATYITIFLSIYIFCWYSYKYYELSKSYLDKCEQTSDNNTCIKTDFTHFIVPYVGILYGFFMTFYKICNLFALFLNYACCCIFCFSLKKNVNEIEGVQNSTVEISINKIVDC